MELLVISALLIGMYVIWTRRTSFGRSNAASPRSKPPLFSKNRCNWSLRNASASGVLREFECATCGVTAYSTERAGPKQCKKGLDSAKL